jgi:hypothetical protein
MPSNLVHPEQAKLLALGMVDHDELPHPVDGYLSRAILDRFGREKHPVSDRAGSFIQSGTGP